MFVEFLLCMALFGLTWTLSVNRSLHRDINFKSAEYIKIQNELSESTKSISDKDAELNEMKTDYITAAEKLEKKHSQIVRDLKDRNEKLKGRLSIAESAKAISQGQISQLQMLTKEHAKLQIEQRRQSSAIETLRQEREDALDSLQKAETRFEEFRVATEAEVREYEEERIRTNAMVERLQTLAHKCIHDSPAIDQSELQEKLRQSEVSLRQSLLDIDSLNTELQYYSNLFDHWKPIVSSLVQSENSLLSLDGCLNAREIMKRINENSNFPGPRAYKLLDYYDNLTIPKNFITGLKFAEECNFIAEKMNLRVHSITEPVFLPPELDKEQKQALTLLAQSFHKSVQAVTFRSTFPPKPLTLTDFTTYELPNHVAAQLHETITSQRNLVNESKAKNANSVETKAAIAHLLELKKEYKDLTGSEYHVNFKP